MTDLIRILTEALQSTPATVIPFLLTLVLIGYLSYKIYQEFKKVYLKVNTEMSTMALKISKVEADISKTDERTAVLSMKLEKIENNLEKINCSLIELSTTLKIWREKE